MALEHKNPTRMAERVLPRSCLRYPNGNWWFFSTSALRIQFFSFNINPMPSKSRRPPERTRSINPARGKLHGPNQAMQIEADWSCGSLRSVSCNCSWYIGGALKGSYKGLLLIWWHTCLWVGSHHRCYFGENDIQGAESWRLLESNAGASPLHGY